MSWSQDAPFAVQIELVEGCNLYCDFCGLQGIRTAKDKTFKFMDLDHARSIAKQLRELEWNARIEFAMHGEPTLHPDYVMAVAIFRRYLKKNQLMMTSNGGGLLRPPGVLASLTELFDAGLNVFAFDAYEYVKIKDKIDPVLFESRSVIPFDVHRYPDEKEFSPHNRYPKNARKFIRIEDISKAEKGTHSILNNHTGCGSPPLKKSITARCAKPFRELAIRWDGSIAICCNDWRGVYKTGNAVDDGIETVWNGEEFNSARRFLMQGDRQSINPCNICDAKSYRVGLLPDKFGKRKMRKPTKDDLRIVTEAAAGKPYTKPVKPAYLGEKK